MNNNTLELIKELEETKSILNGFLARKIEKENNKDIIGRKEAIEEGKIKKKLYKIFLSRIDPSDSEILVNLDKEIDRITDYIEQKSGFYRTSYGFRKEDNFINQGDPEFATHDTYVIDRNEYGYTYNDKKPFNEYFARIQKKEKEFCKKYEKELNELHNYLTKKENILKGDYKLKDSRDRELLRYISIYLGYKDEENKEISFEDETEEKIENKVRM